MNLTSNLVPIISKAGFDDEATKFLEQYCPEALNTPMAVPIGQIASERMGLTVLSHNLTEDLSIFGCMCFSDGLVEIYDNKEDEYRAIRVDGGTMIVDPDVFFRRSLGCLNNTIAHECFHWFRHRPYHLVQTMISNQRSVACRCSTDPKEEKTGREWTDDDWMEWQANGIAPRILLPKNMFCQVVGEIGRGRRGGLTTDMSVMDSIVQQLASFFRVSKISVRIRLQEVGLGLL